MSPGLRSSRRMVGKSAQLLLQCRLTSHTPCHVDRVSVTVHVEIIRFDCECQQVSWSRVCTPHFHQLQPHFRPDVNIRRSCNTAACLSFTHYKPPAHRFALLFHADVQAHAWISLCNSSEPAGQYLLYGVESGKRWAGLQRDHSNQGGV